jgi:hypothetical protein
MGHYPSAGQADDLVHVRTITQVRRDLEAAEQIVCATSLEWTIARPPRLIQFEEKLELLLTIREHEHVQWTGKYRVT